MTEKRVKVINISTNGMMGLFKLGNDNLSVFDVVRLLNELLEENGQLKSYTGEMEDYLARLEEKNEQLKQENSVFEGKDAKHYQRWVKQIKKYVEETNTDFTYDDDFIIKIALSYTLQSLRNGESLKRFQWDYEELGE